MDKLFIVIIWLIIAYLGSTIALKKGRDRLTWFIIIFLTSLIGVLILAMLPPV